MSLKADDIILQEAIIRVVNYQTALREVININNKIEKSTKEIANLTGTKLKKAMVDIEILEKKRVKDLKYLNKVYKKYNGDITHNVRNQTSLVSAYKNTRKEADRLTNSYDKLSKSQKKVNNLSSLIRRVGAGILAYASVRGFINFLKNTEKLIVKLNSLNLTLQTVAKSLEEQTVITGFLEDISGRYGLEIISLTNRFLKFKAAADQSNFELSKTMKIYDSITKAGSIMGLSQYEIEGALLAVEQMMSKGKVTTEELRRQLGERLPGAMGIMAKAAGVSLQQLDKMMKKGELLSSEILPKFGVALEQAYGIEKVNKVETLMASQNKLTNAWTLFVKSVEEGDSVISSVLRGIYDGFARNLKLLYPFAAKLKDIEESASSNTARTYQEEFTKKFITDDMDVKDIEKLVNLHIKKTQASIKMWRKYNDNLKDAYDDTESYGKSFLKQIQWFSSFGINGENAIDMYNEQERRDKLKEELKKYNKELGVEEGKLVALRDILKGLYGDNSALGGGSKNKKIKLFNKKDLDTYHKKMITVLGDEINYIKEIANNKHKDSNERIQAYDDILKRINLINEYEQENKGQKLYLKYLSDVKKAKKGNFVSEKDKLNYLSELEKKYLYDLEVINIEYENKKRTAAAQTITKKIQIIKDGLNVELQIEKSKVNASKSMEMVSLNERYKSGKINKEKYEKEKLKIEDKYLKKSLEKELKYAKKLLNTLINTGGGSDEIEAMKERIASINEAISEIGISDIDSYKEKLSERIDYIKDTINEIGNIVDNLYQKNIDSLERYQEKLIEFYDKQYELAENDKAQQELITKEKERKEKELNKKILKERQKQAKAEKLFAIFDIGIATAVNVAKSSLKPYLIPYIIALGIAQAATVISKPIPQYRYGTKNKEHQGGLAELGEGGVSEVVLEPGKKPYLTPSKSTYMYLEKGTKVYPNIDDYRKSTMLASINMQNISNKSKGNDINFDMIDWSIGKEIKKGFRNVNTNISIKQNFNQVIKEIKNLQF